MWATKGLTGSSGLCPLGQNECQEMARTGKYLGAGRMRAPVAHQPLSHILSALKTMADLRRAVLEERTPKNTLKLCLETKAPPTPVQPQKQPLAPMRLLQYSQVLLLGKDMAWRDRAGVPVSSLSGASPGITAQSTPLLAHPWSIVCTS